jgi:hypothetical protein
MLSTCLLAVLFFVQDQPKPLPELKPFLAELRKNLHSDGLLLSQYTYTEKRTVIRLDSNQKPQKTEVNVFEVTPGSPDRVGYRRQIVKDGKPLSQAELKKQDQEFQKRSQDEQRKISQRSPAEREKARADRLRHEEMVLDDVFGTYKTEIVGREDLRGRSVIQLKFTPQDGYKPKTDEGQRMPHVAGRAWVSEEDHQISRVELNIIDPISIGFVLAKLQKGSSITAEREKFNDEIWLPVKNEVTINARVLLLKGFNLRVVTEYSDHKKFSVDTILKFPDLEKE